MDKNNKKAYNAIKNFVVSLFEVFHDNKPLALYNKLISKTQNEKVMMKHVKSFSSYLEKNKSKIISNMNLKKSDVIKYDNSDGVFIDLPLFISKSDKETLNVIKAHLITLISIFYPDEKLLKSSSSTNSSEETNSSEKMNEINPIDGINPMSFIQDNLDTSTKEGQFLNNTLKNITENLDVSEMDMSNPMSLITNLMSSGLATNLMENMSGLEDSGFDQSKMFDTMKNLMSGITKQIDPESRKKVKTLLNDFSALLDDSPPTNSIIPQQRVEEHIESTSNSNVVEPTSILESTSQELSSPLEVSTKLENLLNQVVEQQQSNIDEISRNNEEIMNKIENSQ